MRTRDVYATLLDLVTARVDRRDEIVRGWSDRADPIWRRGDSWVRVEAHRKDELVVVAGRGDDIVVERTHTLTGDLEPIAAEVVELLNAAGTPAP